MDLNYNMENESVGRIKLSLCMVHDVFMHSHGLTLTKPVVIIPQTEFT